MKKNEKVILLLLLFFLVLRIGIVIVAGQNESEFADGVSYNGYATAILRNSDWLTNPDFVGNHRPPIYPMFIAIIYAIFGIRNFLAVYIFQAFISTLTCFYIYKLSKRIFNEKVALLSLIWSGFYIFYLQYVRMLLRETLIFFLIIVFFYYLYLYLTDENRKTRYFWLSLIFYFSLIHTDPRYLFYLPFLIILFIIYQPFWQGVKKYFIFLGITILLMVPWSIRNYIACGGVVIINTRGIDLRKKDERSYKMSSYQSNASSFGIINTTSRKNYPTEEERELIKQGLNPKGRTKDELIAVKNDVYPDSTFFGRKLYWLIELWRPARFSPDYFPFPDARFQGRWSLKHNLSGILCYGLLLPFMILGIYFLVKQRNKVWFFLVFPILTQTLLHFLQWGRNRYRMPIDSFIIIIAFYGLQQIYIATRTRSYSHK